MRKPFETICVIGMGYIGLPTAAVLASKAFDVHGVDIKQEAIAAINRGEVHIAEPDLDVLVRSVVKDGRLKVSSSPIPADVFIVAVPTPFKEGRVPDMSYVEAAVKALAPHLRPGNLVVLESTSPVGTTEKMIAMLRELRPDIFTFEKPNGDNEAIFAAYCPERVLPGCILKELVENDRVVGGINKASSEKAGLLYRSFVKGEILLTDARTAEMCKLTENAFRDVNIAFANELSLLCGEMGVNVWRLIELANRHPRVNILRPGPGVGGHCIAVDPWFLIHAAPRKAMLIHAARDVNDGMPEHVVELVSKKAARFANPVIACLGLSFKADVDDLRESPAVEVVHWLSEKKVGRLLAVEPHVKSLPKILAGSECVLTDLQSALDQADVVVMLTDHRVFRELDIERIRGKEYVDTRGIWR